MKKTLIALSLAALSTAAMADVTLYGTIKAGVETGQTKVKTTTTTEKSHTVTQIADFGSRIGFKGHENLGNGLNAIWKVEQKTSVAGTDKGWGNRQAYIGLETTAVLSATGKMSTQLDEMDKTDAWEYDNKALGLGIFTRTGQKLFLYATILRYSQVSVQTFSLLRVTMLQIQCAVWQPYFWS